MGAVRQSFLERSFQVNFRIAEHPFLIGNVLSAPRRAY